MPPIIPISEYFDQPTLRKLIDADTVVQRYRALFALFDWSGIDAPAQRGPGKPAHPQSAYLKAALVRINQHLSSTPRWRAYLLDHPLLVLELGFRPHLDISCKRQEDSEPSASVKLSHLLAIQLVRTVGPASVNFAESESSRLP